MYGLYGEHSHCFSIYLIKFCDPHRHSRFINTFRSSFTHDSLLLTISVPQSRRPTLFHSWHLTVLRFCKDAWNVNPSLFISFVIVLHDSLQRRGSAKASGANRNDATSKTELIKHNCLWSPGQILKIATRWWYFIQIVSSSRRQLSHTHAACFVSKNHYKYSMAI